MSSALVPSSGFSNFAQQGSVDWVALSNSSVQFSVAVLARLSKAGIDAFTLQFGRAICCNFALEPRAQELVAEAIHNAKKYGSYGDLIWFGFGIKDIVSDLADTEEGLTLVALCAALSTTYDSMFVAKVIRELCVLCKAPQSFTPALRQWRMLVDLCAGILASSRFVTLANGFRLLISGHLKIPLETRHCPTTCLALAEAILTLGRISKRSLVSTTISGGLECAWLAAFAESILSLDVGICDSKGGFFYRSRQSAEALPQLTILLCPTNAIEGSEIIFRSKASVIPKGQSLLEKDPALRGISLLNWQCSWSTILHDAFGGSVGKLLRIQDPRYGNRQTSAFALYLKCISLLQRRDYSDQYYNGSAETLNTSFNNHPVNPLIWNHPDSRGQQFLNFAARRLPELSACLSEHLPLIGEDEVDLLGGCALEQIEGACQCAHHQPGPTQWDSRENDTVCLLVLAEIIVIYLWILIDSDINDDVLPSITGLSNLYTWQLPANRPAGPAQKPFYASVMNCDYPVLGIDLVFHVLSGLSVSGTPARSLLSATDQLARVGSGICVYHQAVEDPALPLETIFRLRVVRGYISYSGFRYKDLYGMHDVYLTDSLQLNNMHGDAPILSVKTVIQETTDETRLEMAYLLDYIDQSCKRRSCWLHLPYLFRKLQRIVRNTTCPKGCDGLHNPNMLLYDLSLPRGSSFEEPDPRIDIISMDNARQLLTPLASSTNTWLLYSHPDHINIVIGQPLLLYILVTQSSRCVAPFTDCLGCIIDKMITLGLFNGWYEKHHKYMAVLLTSDKVRVELLWADSECSSN